MFDSYKEATYHPNKLRVNFFLHKQEIALGTRRNDSSFPTMKIHRAKTKPKKARRDVNVKHHRGAPQIEPTGFRCRVLEIRMSPASTFTILLFLAAMSHSFVSQ